jgi:hypothetical protein
VYIGFKVEFDGDPDCKILVVEHASKASLEHKIEVSSAKIRVQV